MFISLSIIPKSMLDQELELALEHLGDGRFVIVYDADGREEECDFFLAAEFCQPSHVATMRKEGGGLIFLMVRPDIRDRLELPFLQEMYMEKLESYPVLKALISDDIPYDTKSSFSFSVNHRKTFTGITDRDRALTIREFGLISANTEGMSQADAMVRFGERFRTPGHVPICLATHPMLVNRFGHTELSCALSTMAGLTGVSVGCEIMGDDGRAKDKEEVKGYAREHGIPFLDGRQIIDAWSGWEGEWKRSYNPSAADRSVDFKGPDEAGNNRSVIPEKTGLRVMATGVFDLLHPGHLYFLRKARNLGDELIVVVARDSTVINLKHHPITNERIRREMVEALSMVDRAMLGYEGGHLRIVKEIGPDIIALGYDQEPKEEELEKLLSKEGLDVKVVRLDQRGGDLHGTSKIIERIKKRGSDD